MLCLLSNLLQKSFAGIDLSKLHIISPPPSRYLIRTENKRVQRFSSQSPSEEQVARRCQCLVEAGNNAMWKGLVEPTIPPLKALSPHNVHRCSFSLNITLPGASSPYQILLLCLLRAQDTTASTALLGGRQDPRFLQEVSSAARRVPLHLLACSLRAESNRVSLSFFFLEILKH